MFARLPPNDQMANNAEFAGGCFEFAYLRVTDATIIGRLGNLEVGPAAGRYHVISGLRGSCTKPIILEELRFGPLFKVICILGQGMVVREQWLMVWLVETNY